MKSESQGGLWIVTHIGQGGMVDDFEMGIGAEKVRLSFRFVRYSCKISIQLYIFK